MRYYIWDEETIPLPEPQLLELMPDHIRTPIMPEAIKNPPLVDLSKCPVYGGDTAKQAAWKDDKEAKWIHETNNARALWEEKAIEAKQRFIDDAALSPITASVKLVGIKDLLHGIAHIFMVGVTQAEVLKTFIEPQGRLYPCVVEFHPYATEAEMLSALSTAINSGAVIPGSNDQESDFKLVTFFGNGFDFPFIFKRCWILGAVVPWLLRKGRYWNDAISADLHDVFTFGDRSQKTGGLDQVAKLLGTRRKSGSGEQFYQLWASDSVAAVLYLLDDLSVTEEAAIKMGVVRPLKGKA